jgi:tetratricopeptide (TPR) repeat protein
MELLHLARRHRSAGEYDLARQCAVEAADAASSEEERAQALAEEARNLVRLGLAPRAQVVATLAASLGAAPQAEVVAALAEALLAVGDLAAARTAAETARQLAEAAHGPVSIQAALAIDGLAVVVAAAGDAPGGLGLVMRALAVLEQAGGAGQDRALLLHTLAELHHRAGQYEAALATWEETLELRTTLLGADHPETLATMSGMALSLSRAGHPEAAVPLFRHVATQVEAQMGRDHPAVAACRHGLAQALHRIGQWPEARDQLTVALAISERCQGADHLDTWITRLELGRLEMDCGQVEEGLARMEAARAAVMERLGPDHPQVRAMNRWL